VSDLLAHRGFTHSLLFAFLSTPIFAWGANKLERRVDLSYARWNLFFLIEILLHLFIDSFNAYGTGWFEPFSHARISFHTLYVADPLFSIVPVIAFIVLLFLRNGHTFRKKWAWAAVFVSFAYLGISILNKNVVDKEAQTSASNQHIQYNRYLSTPTPFNSLLWLFVL
jgi:inner membrane protein